MGVCTGDSELDYALYVFLFFEEIPHLISSVFLICVTYTISVSLSSHPCQSLLLFIFFYPCYYLGINKFLSRFNFFLVDIDVEKF